MEPRSHPKRHSRADETHAEVNPLTICRESGQLAESTRQSRTRESTRQVWKKFTG
jgi:hypothetical protein